MTKERQEHPKGDLVSISPDERRDFRAQRESLGLDQKDVAARVGVTPATISNIETGRSRQVKRPVYLKLRRVLYRSDQGGGSVAEVLRKIDEDLLTLDERDLAAILALSSSLRRR